MNEIMNIKDLIYTIRGCRVMLDSDLAMLYGVETYNLNKAVKRNIQRFPEDFMFQLTKEEWNNLIFQNGISKSQHGGRRFMPYAFTEQGIAMLSSVLKSEQAMAIGLLMDRTKPTSIGILPLIAYTFGKSFWARQSYVFYS